MQYIKTLVVTVKLLIYSFNILIFTRFKVDHKLTNIGKNL
jgi:hypothetical protein